MTSTQKQTPLKQAPPLSIAFLRAIAVLVIVTLPVAFLWQTTAIAAQAPVNLRTADSFAVLAGSEITNTGPTTITGDVGVHPGSSVSGFGSVTLHGQLHIADAVAQQAKSDLNLAYDDAAGRTPVSTIATELGGQVLAPGVYDSASGTFGMTGILTLDAGGVQGAVFIFKTATTLITAMDSGVNLINGADACNVFWKVGSSATLGKGSTFKGTILALTSITVTSGASVIGRTLARNGAVTMDSNTITRSACSGASPSPSPTSTSTTTQSASANPTATSSPTSNPTGTASPTSNPTGTASPTSNPTGTASPTSHPTVVSSPTPGPTKSSPAPNPHPTTNTRHPDTSGVLGDQFVVPAIAGAPRTGGPPDDGGFPGGLIALLVGSVGIVGARRVVRVRPHALRSFVAVLAIVSIGNASAGLNSVSFFGHDANGSATSGRMHIAIRPKTKLLRPLSRNLDLHAPPVSTRLELHIPALGITGRILGVGITAKHTMDAPMGSRTSPVWQEAFWYRGSGVPGDTGTATIAGHVRGGRGPALFAHLDRLRFGDVIVVRDARNGMNVRFIVTGISSYSLAQLRRRTVLVQMYGSGPVAGRRPQSSRDGVANLTLVTCSGGYGSNGFDHRLVVYAKRIV